MDFLFFNAANQPLFTRNDAERAEWTVEQFSFFGLFPFDAGKVIERGQRVAFQDADGNWQAFEIRKAKSYEPDHYQEITAEHIAVAELTDEHVQPKEWTNQTAQAALSSILTGTLWSIGTVTASGTSSGEISYGSVWQGVNTIASNWNVYILPRITIGASGITGRYLDITPAKGNWRGLRLSINSNIEEAGVTYDDTNVLTAMYGYGKTSTPDQPITPTSPQPQDLPAEPLTFTDVVWTATAEHPAKPANQAYLENPTAKALYGRNGRNRFGYYQNGDVTDPNVLLQLTWDALKKDSEPLISIDGTLHDLKRLGYADQTIRLYDTAIVEILPAGVEVQREIIQLDVDLLNPLATRVTIGAYIPNIIYINKETSAYASGNGGYGSGGRRGQTTKEKEWSEFETEISANQYQILLRAWQQNKNNEILRQAGIQLNAQGVLVYATDSELNIGSKIQTQADRISLVVEGTGENAKIKPAAIVAAVNAQTGQSTVRLSADMVELDGNVIVGTKGGQQGLTAPMGYFHYLYGEYLDLNPASGIQLLVNSNGTQVQGYANFTDTLHVDGTLTVNDGLGNDIDVINAVASIGPATASGGQITIPWTKLDGSPGTAVNFNIADTQFYQDGVSAAYSRGVADGGGTAVASAELVVRQDGGQIETLLVNGESVQLIAGETCEVDIRYNGNYIKWGEISAPSVGTPFIDNPNAGYIRPAVRVNGVAVYGETIKLTSQQIADWGGPIT